MREGDGIIGFGDFVGTRGSLTADPTDGQRDAAPPDECGTALPDGRRSGASPDPLSDSTVMFLADFAQFALK